MPEPWRPPRPDNEAERLAALRGYDILDTLPEREFDDIVTLVAKLCRTPMALLSFIDADRQWFKAELGLGVRQTPRDVAICAHAILQEDLFVVPDMLDDPRFARSPLVRDDPHLRFYAGAPLKTAAGHALGMLCVLDVQPRELTEEQTIALRILADQVMSRLEMRRTLLENTRLYDDLQEREAKIRRLVDANVIGIFTWDITGRIVEANDAFLRLVQYNRDDVLSCRVRSAELTPPEWRDADRRAAAEMMASGTVQPYEKEYQRKDGSRVPVLVGAAATRGRHDQGLAFVLDLTDRKRAEEASRRSERHLRDVIETIPTMVWTALPDGSNDFGNQRWMDYTGRPSRASADVAWQAEFHPDDIHRHMRKWRASLETGEPFDNEARLQRAADGEYRWFLIRGVPLRDEPGNIVKWYGTATDIEDRKRAEGFLAGEKRILEMVARGDSLAGILDAVCRFVEEEARDVLASILLLDASGKHVKHGGAPSLPKAYTDAIDGLAIGPCAGSCGTAAYRGEQVIVSDIATDPLWADYRDVALPHSLRACWSTPIFSSDGKVVGTFAMYYREPRRPSRRDQDIIGQITHLAGVAIQRKLAEDDLRQSEAYLAEAQRMSHMGNWARIPDAGEIRYWSEECYRVLGFDPNGPPPLFASFLERIHPEDRARFRARVDEAVSEKADYDQTYRIIHPDGEIRDIHAVGHPVLDGSGNVVEYFGTVLDVTERKRAEEALRESEEKWRAVFENNPTMYFVIDAAGTIVSVNPFGAEQLGYTVDELVGQSVLNIFFEADREAVKGNTALCFEQLGRSISWEFRKLRKDGTIIWVRETARAMLMKNRPVVLIVCEDISERKHAEYLTSQVFESSPDSIAIIGRDYRLQRVNPAIERRLGMPADKFVGMPLADVVGADIFERAIKPHLDRCFLGEEVSFEHWSDLNGRRFMAVTCSPLRPDGHRVAAALTIARDLTDHMLASEALREAQTELAHVNRVTTMGQLTASIAHEVNQPVAAVVTNAQAALRWLSAQPPELQEVRQALGRIVKDSNRASDVIGQIRALIKKVPRRSASVNVNETILEVIALTRSELIRNGVSLQTQLAQDLPLIRGDRIQLQQVIINLIINAIDAMNEMSDRAREIQIATGTDASNMVLVAIRDSGPGLAPESLGRLFEAFYTTKTSGMGMGLSICRSIIEAHGGHVWASANTPKGAIFQFKLPQDEETAS